jgi:hypothetical protein
MMLLNLSYPASGNMTVVSCAKIYTNPMKNMIIIEFEDLGNSKLQLLR